MDEPKPNTELPAKRNSAPLTPGKRILLSLALVAVIASAVFSMWQTVLQSLADDAALLKESQLHSIRAAFTWDPVRRELLRVLASERRGVERVESWKLDPGLFHRYAEENGVENPHFAREVSKIVARIRSHHEHFVARHPDHAPGRIAFGDFFEQVSEYEAAVTQWEIAMKLDPELPDAWDRQGRTASANDDFSATLSSYAHAIELEPDNWNFHYQIASISFNNLSRAAEHFSETQDQAADRAILHYRLALQHNPSNFELAGELAFAYAHLAPPDLARSMAVWERSMRYARDERDRESVYLSMAQISIDSEQFEAAREQVALSSLSSFRGQRSLLLKRIEAAEKKSKQRRDG